MASAMPAARRYGMAPLVFLPSGKWGKTPRAELPPSGMPHRRPEACGPPDTSAKNGTRRTSARHAILTHLRFARRPMAPKVPTDSVRVPGRKRVPRRRGRAGFDDRKAGVEHPRPGNAENFEKLVGERSGTGLPRTHSSPSAYRRTRITSSASAMNASSSPKYVTAEKTRQAPGGGRIPEALKNSIENSFVILAIV